MEKLKSFYRNYSNHIWLLVVVLLLATLYSILVFREQTPLVWGLYMFVFGFVLIFLCGAVAPLREDEKFLVQYLFLWTVCVVLFIGMMIFWGLYIPHDADTSVIVVGVLAWYVCVWLLGIFFAYTRDRLRRPWWNFCFWLISKADFLYINGYCSI